MIYHQVCPIILLYLALRELKDLLYSGDSCDTLIKINISKWVLMPIELLLLNLVWFFSWTSILINEQDEDWNYC
jgi:hypothetical protein